VVEFYHTNEVPDFYKCSVCGAKGIKLWRQYNTCPDYLELMCAPCGCKNQKIEDNVDEQGKAALGILQGMRCDQLMSLVPAVPCEDSDTYWGYTSVPELGVQWWRRLPTRCAQEVGR